MADSIQQSNLAAAIDRAWERWAEGDAPPDLRALLRDNQQVSPAELAEALRVDALERHKRGFPFGVSFYESQLDATFDGAPAAATLLMLQIALESSDGDYDSCARALRESLPERLSPDIDAALAQLADDKEAGGEPSAVPRSHAEARIGETLGGCKITEIIDAGAQGVVYRAREHPDHGGEFDQTVAVKVLNTKVARKADVARFEAESEFISRLSHPGVARVFRTGRTNDDRPYFVMEFVPGLPITDFADRKRLTIRQRLELFRQVCEAVGHIHQRQLIHRDLKPSNILVTETAIGDGKRVRQVKIIDFGLAKSVGAQLSRASMVTNVGDVIGTLSYMAPEQAGHDLLDVDQRADVFALGAVLFELLTGRAPLDQRAAEESSARRKTDIYTIVRSAERPSAVRAVETLGDEGIEVARQRSLSGAAQLLRVLENELQWIPACAMRLEPDRRYQTPMELARDIENYLRGRPLIAGPDSKWYRIRKTIRQHRAPLGVAAALVAVIAIGGAAAGVGFWKAEQRAAELEGAVSFMETIVLEKDPTTGFSGLQGSGRNVTLVDVLEKAPDLVGVDFNDIPWIETRLLSAIGRSLVFLGEERQAIPVLEKTLASNRASFLGTPLGWDTALALAEALTSDGDPRAALQWLTRLDEHDPPTPDYRAEWHAQQAIALKFDGQFDASIPHYEAALRTWSELHGAHSREALNGQFIRALLDRERGDKADDEDAARRHREEARQQMASVLQQQRLHLGPRDVSTLNTCRELGTLHSQLKEFETAEEFLAIAIVGLEQTLGKRHWRTLQAVANMGACKVRQQDFAAAVEYYKSAFEGYQEANLLHHKDALATAFAVAKCYDALGQPSAGIAIFEDSLVAHTTVCTRPHDHIGRIEYLISLQEQHGDEEDATPWRARLASLSIYSASNGTAEADR